jgi:hypothetical protein
MSTFLARIVAAAVLTASSAMLSASPAASQEHGGGRGEGGDGESFWRWGIYRTVSRDQAAAAQVPERRLSSQARRRPPVREASPRPRRSVAARPAPSRTAARPRPRPPTIARRPGGSVPPSGERRFVADEVLLQPASNVSADRLDRLAQQYRLTRIASDDLALIGPVHRFRITDGRSVSSVVRRLESDRRVASAQPNFLFTLQQPAARTAAPPQYGLDKLRLPDAHRVSRGREVLIAVIDSGIDEVHPELAGAMAGNLNVADGIPEGHAHGTAVAAAIAARGQLVGTAPAARLLGIRAFAPGSSAPGASGTSYHILKALDGAHRNQAKVANMSFAGPRDPLLSRMLKEASERGMVLVAAAGNAGPRSKPLYPAADPNVIAVTATDADDRLYPAANRGRHIAVAAPGVDILVAAPGASYGLTSGTSIAAAHVSGLAALLLEIKPDLDSGRIKSLLATTARDLGPIGADEEFGAGVPDAQKALDALAPKTADLVK